jgi:anti-sigma B factor antagonist
MLSTEMKHSIGISTSGSDNQTEPKPSISRIQEEGDVEAGKGAPMLSLKIQNLGDVTVFQCAGRITAEDENAFRKAVLAESHVRMVVLDLAEVSAVDAAGLGMLVAVRAWAKATGTELKLMNLTPRVEEVLQLTNLRSAFEVCSVREMFDLLCRASRRPSQFEAVSAAIGHSA